MIDLVALWMVMTWEERLLALLLWVELMCWCLTPLRRGDARA